MEVYSNIHSSFVNVDDLTDAEFEAVEIKFFDIFGRDKDSSEIEVLEKEYLEQGIAFHCLYQENPFIVRLLH